MANVQIGDQITFRAATRHSDRVATRIVNGFDMGRPTVRYHGWTDFIVKEEEITGVKHFAAIFAQADSELQ